MKKHLTLLLLFLFSGFFTFAQADTKKDIKIAEEDVLNDFRLSPDGRYLVLVSRDLVARYDLQNNTRQTLPNPTVMHQAMISPCGKFVLFASWSGRIFKMMRLDW